MLLNIKIKEFIINFLFFNVFFIKVNFLKYLFLFGSHVINPRFVFKVKPVIFFILLYSSRTHLPFIIPPENAKLYILLLNYSVTT